MRRTEQWGHLRVLFCTVYAYYCNLKAIKMEFRMGQAAQIVAAILTVHLKSGNMSPK